MRSTGRRHNTGIDSLALHVGLFRLCTSIAGQGPNASAPPYCRACLQLVVGVVKYTCWQAATPQQVCRFGSHKRCREEEPAVEGLCTL